MEPHILGIDLSWSKALPKMSQPKSKSFFSKGRPQWKGTASSSLFSNSNASSLVPSSFSNAHFGLFGSFDGQSMTTGKHSSMSLTPEMVNQSGHGESRRHRSDKNTARGRANVLQLSACHSEVSMSSRNSRRTVEEMMRAGRVDHTPGIQPAVDLPVPSTAGRVDGEFWKQRREAPNSCSVQPLGTLYTSSVGDGVQNCWELPRGKSLQGNARINQNHSVSTGCEQGSRMDERSIWLSSSHKLGVNHVLLTQFANDLKGGNTFSMNSTHNLTPNAMVSSNLFTNSFGESSVEVELQREKNEANKRRQHELKFMTTIPFQQSGSVSSSLVMDLCGSQKFSMYAMQKIHDQIMVGACVKTNLKKQDSMSVEAKHQLDGLGTLVLKVTNDLCFSRVDISTSITTKRNSWVGAFRNAPAEAKSLRLEWRRRSLQNIFFDAGSC